MEESRENGEGRGLAARFQQIVRRFIAPAASAAFAFLWTLAHAQGDFPEAAWVFLVPLLLWFFTGPSRRSAFLWVLAAALISWIIRIAWLANFTAHLSFAGAGLAGWAAVIALSAVLAVFPAIWAGFGAVWVYRSLHFGVGVRILSMAGLAGLWIVLEWIQTWVFTGFPWLPVAASQWQRPLLLQILSLTGAAGLGFVLVFFNAGLAFYLRSLTQWRGKRWWQRLSGEFYAAFGLIGLIVLIGYQQAGEFARQQELFRVAFVQPNVPAAEKWDQAFADEVFADLEHLTTLAGFLEPDIILWPEATLPFPLKSRFQIEDWMHHLSRNTGRPIFGGAVIKESEGDAERWYNAVVQVDPENGVDLENYYAKRHLVPFGEYVPFARFLPWLDKVIPLDGSFFRGTEIRQLSYTTPIRTVRFGPLVCYEDIFPGLARDQVKAGADVLFVVTNNAWFGEGSGAWQHAAHSVLRAVENRRPVLRCGNAGWSGWIDDHGHIRHTSMDNRGSIFFRGVDTSTITRSANWVRRQSFYTRWGDWFVWVGFAFALGLVSALRRGADA